MSDISTAWDYVNNRGDWQVQAGALASGNDLVTAVLISLFTDRRAAPSDTIPDGTNNPRGWWADNGADGNTDLWGSRLWLLDRSKAPTQQVLNAAVNYCNEALAWMITDGVAASIDVQASWQQVNFLAIQVNIYKTNGTNQSLKFQLLWNQLSGGS
jgi:phage gp46-like protein